jgi:3-hydroxyisobutyrate dehydrogenase-like beta-hydroxyacid dehydrogenase
MSETLTTDTRLGYIGLGSMGAPMAKRLVGWPGGLVVFDVRDEAMAAFAHHGFKPIR